MKNWKTTAIGFIFGAGWIAFKGLVLKKPLTIEDFKDGAAITALGIASKDYNVTGGTTPQNQTWLGKIISKVKSFIN